MQPANGDTKAVVTYREIENALTEGTMNEAISRLGEAAQTPEQGDRFLADFAQALRLIELEEEQADPELLTVPRDRLASLTLSSLAEDPPEESSFVELATGGAEVVFSNRDILGWLRSHFDWVGQLRPHDASVWYRAGGDTEPGACGAAGRPGGPGSTARCRVPRVSGRTECRSVS